MGINVFGDQNLLVLGAELLGLLLMANLAGRRLGVRHSRKDQREKLERIAGTITGAMLALFGFILAISLSMADSHFQARRRMIIDEANAIGTSRLRAETVSGPHGREISRLLKEYIQVRIAFFAAGEDRQRLDATEKQTAELQRRIWEEASAIARASPTPIAAILLQSLNETFDIATTRRWALEIRVPAYVMYLLVLLAALAVALMGYYFSISGVRGPILSGILISAFVIAMLLVADLNRPRSGFISAEQSALFWLNEN
jgi:hypothetical protein